MTNPTVLIACLALAACAPTPDKSGAEPSVGVGLANPASVYCVEKGGRLEIVTGKDGGQTGLCHLPDGSSIDEWALFRRDHP